MMMVGRSVVIWELIVVPNWSRSKCSSNDVSFLDTSDKMCNEDGASKLVGKLSLYPTSVADGASPELRMVEGILESLYLSRRSNFCSTSEVWKTKRLIFFSPLVLWTMRDWRFFWQRFLWCSLSQMLRLSDFSEVKAKEVFNLRHSKSNIDIINAFAFSLLSLSIVRYTNQIF